jgi:hypothetical protein
LVAIVLPYAASTTAQDRSLLFTDKFYMSSSVRLCASSQLGVVQGSSCFSRPAGFT